MGLGGVFSGLLGPGLFGSGAQPLASLQAHQDAMNVQLWSQYLQQQMMRPGGWVEVPPGTLQNIHLVVGPVVHTCRFCGRQTTKPDLEYGCRGCGASEWR